MLCTRAYDRSATKACHIRENALENAHTLKIKNMIVCTTLSNDQLFRNFKVVEYEYMKSIYRPVARILNRWVRWTAIGGQTA